MRNLKLIDKFIFILNSVFAFALLLSYLLPHTPPKTFPLLSVLSLGVPLLILSNFIFLVFWVLRFKRQLLLSLIVLALGYNYVFSWFQFNGDTDVIEGNDLNIMSYNVRMFNAYEWVKDDDIPEKILTFIADKDPDVLATQEHAIGYKGIPKIYPYEYIVLKEKASEFGSAIFSKYPIINKGSVNFPHDGNNNAIFVDIVKKEDTLRVFNVHFQSLNIKAGIDDLQKEDSKKLMGRIGYGFKLQQTQAEMMMEEVNNSPYKTIIIGDFNNTAFSYIYNEIKGSRFNDAFLEVGSGFGQTFNLNYFPLRIDFAMIEKSIHIDNFKVFPVKYSDHFPILVNLSL
ncbi:endonuclease/exonuclease/phosphatase family protein [Gillisia sp. M10.2A]|uniref:Endonuclease/exonuclease/phosphatase family protein n=1 Tax=Gillisia lutea TaxID=2909668 RepID=A0ABS9EES2_9FLAO|nr:endonuclease/exonuclease/phosphatase family protein [Gillisia lutea]MCF4101374.1 endonuclease/exonuclease/phosphatase family protein [Gillisia lutea]